MTFGPGVPTLDRDVLERLHQSLGETSDDFLRKLVHVYEGQAAELMIEISSATDQGDLPRLGNAAHSLKGSSATLGGARLATMCEELEHWDGPAEAVSLRVAGVQAELGAFQSELRGFLTQ